MADPRSRQVPPDALVNLRRRLDALPARHPDRKELLRSAAELYGMSLASQAASDRDFSFFINELLIRTVKDGPKSN